jgi:hypothetical protein
VLFASLQGYDAFVRQPYHQLRHPMMFYYGHPAVLYINKLRVAGLLEDGIDQFFEQVRCTVYMCNLKPTVAHPWTYMWPDMACLEWEW